MSSHSKCQCSYDAATKLKIIKSAEEKNNCAAAKWVWSSWEQHSIMEKGEKTAFETKINNTTIILWLFYWYEYRTQKLKNPEDWMKLGVTWINTVVTLETHNMNLNNHLSVEFWSYLGWTWCLLQQRHHSFQAFGPALAAASGSWCPEDSDRPPPAHSPPGSVLQEKNKSM